MHFTNRRRVFRYLRTAHILYTTFTVDNNMYLVWRLVWIKKKNNVIFDIFIIYT